MINLSVMLIGLAFICQMNMNMPSQEPGGRLNKKDGLTRYGDSHVKDKMS